MTKLNFAKISVEDLIESFDSLKIYDLKSIYRNLQSLKSLYCEK
jgi:sulfur relay (sulfurtransferase) DsrF/TusC family protein